MNCWQTFSTFSITCCVTRVYMWTDMPKAFSGLGPGVGRPDIGPSTPNPEKASLCLYAPVVTIPVPVPVPVPVV